MNNVEKGDFIVIDTDGTGKHNLVKALVLGKKIETVVYDQRRNSEGHYEKKPRLEIKPEQVIANLGKTPKPGKVHGVTVEPLLLKADTNTCGQILFFTAMKEKDVKRTTNAFIKAFKRLKAEKLKVFDVEIEIRPPTGKYYGYYKPYPKADHDVLVLRPNWLTMTEEDMQYAIMHESAHGIWTRGMTRKYQARWIQLYDQHMAPNAAEARELKELRQEIEAAGSIREFMKSSEDETRDVVKAVLKHIKQIHGITQLHLEKLLRVHESLKPYWPAHVAYSQRNVIVSEYAMKEPEEFFAEAFAYHMVGKKVGKEVKNLLIQSLGNLQRAPKQSKADEE